MTFLYPDNRPSVDSISAVDDVDSVDVDIVGGDVVVVVVNCKGKREHDWDP